MLAHLRISDFAIIESVELALAPGFNAITGETGAGKSMIIGAASLLRGGRTNAELVRKGSKEAVVEALFDVTRQPRLRQVLAELGLPDEGDELLVRRVVPRSGRGRVYVNGSMCTAGVLSRLGERLFDISGQHEYQSLTDRAVQRDILDEVGRAGEALAALELAYARLRRAGEALGRTRMDERQRSERLDFLRFQLDELEAAGLVAGEDQALELERRRLLSAADLRQVAEQAEARLYGESGSATETIASLCRRLAELQGIDPRLEPFRQQLDEARVILEDAALGLARYGEGVEVDPERMQALDERLDLLHRLKRKHGPSLEAVLARLETMRAERDDLEGLETRRAELEAELEAARAEAARCAARLRVAREQAAGQLSAQMSSKLAALHMQGAQVVVRVEDAPPREDDDESLLFEGPHGVRRLSAHGWDRVDFVAALNPGEDPLPIGRVASGGELSRLMLALQQVLGEHEAVPTAIFDEVDAGISGAVADVVGRSLAEVARHRQVLVVTHLPQVAAYATRHFHVGKARGENGRTTTSVRELESDQRVEELARMLAASKVTAQARASAKELLRFAGRDGE